MVPTRLYIGQWKVRHSKVWSIFCDLGPRQDFHGRNSTAGIPRQDLEFLKIPSISANFIKNHEIFLKFLKISWNLREFQKNNEIFLESLTILWNLRKNSEKSWNAVKFSLNFIKSHEISGILMIFFENLCNFMKF